nr:hypothetical protein [Tanacetum cinerariifolium]
MKQEFQTIRCFYWKWEMVFYSEGGATNPESNNDKPSTLANVLEEVRALRKEVALVKFNDARISKLGRILNDNFMFRYDINPNGNHNAINQGLSSLANHLMVHIYHSACSRLDIDNAKVACHVIGIHKADGKNDSPNSNQNGVKKGLSFDDALIGIHKEDGKNDSPNVNHNVVNKGLSGSATDLVDLYFFKLQSTCSSPDMDNGEVVVAGMGIHKADGQNDIPNANENALDVLIQVACDGMRIDKADGNNDYTYSQREPSTLDVLESMQSNQSSSECSVLTSTTTRIAKIARVANPLALVAQQQPVYHPQTHPTYYNKNSLTRSQQDATRNREKEIVNSPQLIYDQEPSMVDDDDETLKDKEIDKLMALISLSFKKIYKPTNNNLRTSLNTSRAN